MFMTRTHYQKGKKKELIINIDTDWTVFNSVLTMFSVKHGLETQREKFSYPSHMR